MKKLPYFVSFAAAWLFIAVASAQENPVDYVNPFVGTTNYGTTNPGAICPQGMMSVNETGGGLGGLVRLSTSPANHEGFGLQYVQGVGSFSIKSVAS